MPSVSYAEQVSYAVSEASYNRANGCPIGAAAILKSTYDILRTQGLGLDEIGELFFQAQVNEVIAAAERELI
jgi:hypothetical protein